MAEETGVNIYSLMDKEIEKSPAGAQGLLYLPYLLGERMVPDGEVHRRYNELQKIFDESYEALVPIYQQLAEFNR